MFPLIVADLTRGTGHFNASLGAIGAAQGIGASLSTALAGAIVVTAGYSVAFLSLAAIAGAGFLVFLFGMPETRPTEEQDAPGALMPSPAPSQPPTGFSG